MATLSHNRYIKNLLDPRAISGVAGDVFIVIFLTTTTLVLAELALPGFVSAVININWFIGASLILFLYAIIAKDIHYNITMGKGMYMVCVVALDFLLLYRYIALHFKGDLVGLVLRICFIALTVFLLYIFYDQRR